MNRTEPGAAGSEAAGPSLNAVSRPALKYSLGFGNELASEAIEGALPVGQSMPRTPAMGLVHELVSGTTFSAVRSQNRRTHLYRIRPSVMQPELKPLVSTRFLSAPFATPPNPNQMRWTPFREMSQGQDFLDGILTLCGNGSATSQGGMAIHVYLADCSMVNRAFSNSDGEMLILPERGRLRLVTELGILEVRPGEIALVPRGCKFRVELLDPQVRGFVCENYGLPFRLPDLGLIGSTGQANAWDFEIPVAAYEDCDQPTQLVYKFSGNLWTTILDHSPFDVVAWRGNYAPARYDMARFTVIGALAFDHSDPSIYCALTSPSDGVAGPNAELMIIPPRWQVAEHTFRPPPFHRNCVAEFLGVIRGKHDAKAGEFGPGCCSLHNNFAPHGPDRTSFEAGRGAVSAPQKPSDSLVILLESRFPFSVTDAALNAAERDRNYIDCWKSFPNNFSSAR